MSDQVECRICIDFYSERSDDSFILTTCGHLYHKFCIEQAISRRPRCPDCQSQITREGFRTVYGIQPKKCPKNFKITTVGDAAVGKTCLLKRYCSGTFTEVETATVGIGTFFKTVSISGEEVKLNIWDTAGQEVFKSISPQYIRDSHGVVIVYDTLHSETLENCWKWFEFVNNLAPHAVKILMGARSDLRACSHFVAKKDCPYTARRSRCRPPTAQEVQDMADRMGVAFFETSAKTMTNVDIAFRTITGLILQNRHLVRDAIRNDPSRRRLVAENDRHEPEPLPTRSSSCC